MIRMFRHRHDESQQAGRACLSLTHIIGAYNVTPLNHRSHCCTKSKRDRYLTSYPGLRRRKKAKGYCINSEDDLSGKFDFPLQLQGRRRYPRL